MHGTRFCGARTATKGARPAYLKPEPTRGQPLRPSRLALRSASKLAVDPTSTVRPATSPYVHNKRPRGVFLSSARPPAPGNVGYGPAFKCLGSAALAQAFRTAPRSTTIDG